MQNIAQNKTYTTQEVANGFNVTSRNIQMHSKKLTENVDYIESKSTSIGGRPNRNYTFKGIKELSKIIQTKKALDFANQIAIQEAENDPISPLFWQKLNRQEIVAREYLQNALTKKVEELQEAQKQLEHKQGVIDGIAEGVPAKTMRATINQIVRSWVENRAKEYKRKPIQPDFRFAWQYLATEFSYVYHIDLKARCKNYHIKNGHKITRLEMAESIGQLENLYLLATKLFESGVKQPLQLEDKIKIFVD